MPSRSSADIVVGNPKMAEMLARSFPEISRLVYDLCIVRG